MSDISTGFPKNLAYNLKKLDAGFSKTKVKILPDNNQNSIKENGIVRFRITGNGLYDFRTLCMYMTGSCTNGTGQKVHFPRYSSSLIENMSITANNTTLCSINQYNFLYNTLMDLEGADISQMAKRDSAGERHDPSTYFTIPDASHKTSDNPNVPISVVNNVLNATDNDSKVPLCINNWIGMLGSLSTPIVDLADWGDLYINIQFAPSAVCWFGGNADATTADNTPTAPSYTLESIFLTIDRCSFQDPLYYSLKTEKLLSPEGLNVAYYDYFNCQFGSATKSSGVSLNWNVNSASLDQVLVSYRHASHQTIKPLILYGAGSSEADDRKTFREVLANPVSFTDNPSANVITAYYTNLGDAFNNSLYLMRAGASISGSKFAINSIDIDPYKLTPLEIYNKVLQYIGFANLDMGTSGLHAGCMSIHHFTKYYFVDICDLTNISGDNQFWICGLDGRGSGINIQYNADFTAGGSSNPNGESVFPVAYCRSTRVLKINAGRQLVLDPL